VPEPNDQTLDCLLAFARQLATDREISDVLNDLSAHLTELLHVFGAGVSLLSDHQMRFATSDRSVLIELELVQEAEQRGPCVDAGRSGEPVLAGRLVEHGRAWPRYVERARELGIAAVAAVPIRDGKVIGTIDLYDTVTRHWSEREVKIATLLAHMAAGYLHSSATIEAERRTREQLQSALESRVVIEQAKGILAASQRISVDEAFRRLRKRANDQRKSLRSIAESVVEYGIQPARGSPRSPTS
jgi:AmiR/NasT family two-component response regulator